MIWICAAALSAILICAFVFRKYQYRRFIGLDRKEHMLKALYPLSARLKDTFLKRFDERNCVYIKTLMKSLCVKENVEDEIYLYQVKKGAVILFLCICALVCTMFAQILSKGSQQVSTLQRGAYGQGTTSYELEVRFRDEEETMSVDIGQKKPDESEITELFEASYEDVFREMLGENRSAQEVSRPLNLITRYNGFDIYWNLEDTDFIGYSGDIRTVSGQESSEVINLYGTFSLDGVSQIYNFPILITTPVLSEREGLIRRILQEIETTNDVHSAQVHLPENLDGEEISFYTIAGKEGSVILVLAFACAAAILLFYDKKLENTVRKRKEQMMMDFSRIVSKLSLLYEAGLSIHSAFERVVADHERGKIIRDRLLRKKILARKKEEYPSDFAYLEMKLALEKIRSGQSEGQAYAQFGKRCALQPYIKLGNLLERNLNKGAKGMQMLLKEEVDHACEQRKRIARKRGEQASTKMLLPMTLMLLVVIVIIAFPALLSMGL